MKFVLAVRRWFVRLLDPDRRERFEAAQNFAEAVRTKYGTVRVMDICDDIEFVVLDPEVEELASKMFRLV